jgi:hypothetical protein
VARGNQAQHHYRGFRVFSWHVIVSYRVDLFVGF